MSAPQMRPRAEGAGPPDPRWTIILAGLGIFMTALDNLVVATALPVIRTSLHAGLAGLEWTVNAYLLSFACLILTGAALGDRFGRRRMFTVGGRARRSVTQCSSSSVIIASSCMR